MVNPKQNWWGCAFTFNFGGNPNHNSDPGILNSIFTTPGYGQFY